MNAQEIKPDIDESEYEDVLNDIYGDVDICGITYNAGYALRTLDPIAFDCGLQDYINEQDTTWECSKCGTEYDDEDEAEDCCKFECAECGWLHNTEDEALECCLTDGK
jgi:hypothetical protein